MYHDPSHTCIAAVGSFVPSRVVTNDELAAIVDTSDQWIVSHTGIRERRWADEETTFDLAYKATVDLLGRYQTTIDAIVCATATADYPGFPSTASLLSEKLGVTGAAVDVSAGCTGFIYALEIGRGMIATGTARTVLIVGSERLSSVLDMRDRSTCVLFGDGAAAVVLTASDQPLWLGTYIRSEASGSKSLTIDPVTKILTMEGRAVYTFAVRAIAETIDALLEEHKLGIDDIDWIVPHQANQRIIASCAKRYGIDESKFFLNIDRYANTSAASIPLALAEMEQSALLTSGQRVILVGFGAGLTYGGVLLLWK